MSSQARTRSLERALSRMKRTCGKISLPLASACARTQREQADICQGILTCRLGDGGGGLAEDDQVSTVIIIYSSAVEREKERASSSEFGR